jgi:hypothetical protein
MQSTQAVHNLVFDQAYAVCVALIWKCAFPHVGALKLARDLIKWWSRYRVAEISVLALLYWRVRSCLEILTGRPIFGSGPKRHSRTFRIDNPFRYSQLPTLKSVKGACSATSKRSAK